MVIMRTSNVTDGEQHAVLEVRADNALHCTYKRSRQLTIYLYAYPAYYPEGTWKV